MSGANVASDLSVVIGAIVGLTMVGITFGLVEAHVSTTSYAKVATSCLASFPSMLINRVSSTVPNTPMLFRSIRIGA